MIYSLNITQWIILPPIPMTNKILLIIDPQIDFINGILPVPGAEDAMNSLADYVRLNGKKYEHIIVTTDRYPMRHCSFKSEGGKWPLHCIADSVGAAIWPALMNELVALPDKVSVLHKGQDTYREEYSIFKNKYAAEKILKIIESKDINRLEICGIAGDVCVADSICDALALDLKCKINVLKSFSPSLDGGKTLDKLIATHRLTFEK